MNFVSLLVIVALAYLAIKITSAVAKIGLLVFAVIVGYLTFFAPFM